MAWVNEIEKAKTLGQFSTSYLIMRASHGNFETLGSSIASGMVKMLHGDFRKTVLIEDRKAL